MTPGDSILDGAEGLVQGQLAAARPVALCPRVIDVAHMDRFDPALARADGIVGVILKVSTGVAAPDPKFAARIVASSHAGLLVSGYCFGTNQHPGAEQWGDFRHRWEAGCATIGADPRHLPVWLDFERNTDGSIMAVDKARAWLAAAKADGFRPGIYGGLSNLRNTFPTATDPIGAFPLWLAAYGPSPVALHAKPPAPWLATGPVLVQYSDGAHGPDDLKTYPRDVAGAGRPDRSVWFGDEASLRAWWAS